MKLILLIVIVTINLQSIFVRELARDNFVIQTPTTNEIRDEPYKEINAVKICGSFKMYDNLIERLGKRNRNIHYPGRICDKPNTQDNKNGIMVFNT